MLLVLLRIAQRKIWFDWPEEPERRAGYCFISSERALNRPLKRPFSLTVLSSRFALSCLLSFRTHRRATLEKLLARIARNAATSTDNSAAARRGLHIMSGVALYTIISSAFSRRASTFPEQWGLLGSAQHYMTRSCDIRLRDFTQCGAWWVCERLWVLTLLRDFPGQGQLQREVVRSFFRRHPGPHPPPVKITQLSASCSMRPADDASQLEASAPMSPLFAVGVRPQAFWQTLSILQSERLSLRRQKAWRPCPAAPSPVRP